MTTTTRTRFTGLIAAGLIAAALVPAAPAIASPEIGPPATSANGDLVLTTSAPQQPTTSASQLRRDPAAAEAFVADVSTPPRTQTASADDGFDWGSAAIGAGVSLAAVAFGLAGVGSIRHRSRAYSSAPRHAASQGA